MVPQNTLAKTHSPSAMSHGAVHPLEKSDGPPLGKVMFDNVKKYAKKDSLTSCYKILPSIPFTDFQKFDVDGTDLARHSPLPWYLRVGHSQDWDHIIYACISGKDFNKVTFMCDGSTVERTKVSHIEFQGIFAYMNDAKPNTENGQNMVKTLILFCFIDFLRTRKMNGTISITKKFWKYFPKVCKWFKDGEDKRKREEEDASNRQRQIEEDVKDAKFMISSPTDMDNCSGLLFKPNEMQTAPNSPNVFMPFSDSIPEASTGTLRNAIYNSKTMPTAIKRKHSTDKIDNGTGRPAKRPCYTCKQAASQTVIDLAKQIAQLSKKNEDVEKSKKQGLKEKDQLHAQELAKMKQIYKDKLVQAKKDADARAALKDWRINKLCKENTSIGSNLAEEKQKRIRAGQAIAEQNRRLQTLGQQNASLKEQVKSHEDRISKLSDVLSQPFNRNETIVIG